MTYFFDNCIAPPIAEALRALGVEVKVLREEFAQAAKDVAWMPVVAAKGWIAITDDHRIRTRPAEKAVREKAGLRTVFIPPGVVQLTFWAQAAWFVARWPAIEAGTEKMKRGECVVVQMNGKCAVEK